MPRGQPDFGMYAAKETVSGLADVGELVARLGSIVTYDRRGDIVWLDDFESDILKWSYTTFGTGGSFEATAETARNGGFCAKLTTPTGELANITIIKKVPYPVLGKFGYEASFTKDDDHDFILLSSYLFDGTNYKYAGIKVDITNSRLMYIDSKGIWQSLATGITLYEAKDLFYTLKFVVDWVNSKYVRAIFANIEYDLSTYGVYTFGDTRAPYLTIQVMEVTATEAAIIGYVDDVILTQNEP